MALTLNTQGRLKTVSGVYRGGNTPIIIGNTAVQNTEKSLIAGLSIVDDSVTMKAFYDPSLARQGYPGYWDYFTFIQMGGFYISKTPIPLKMHRHDTLRPDYYYYKDGLPKILEWMDVCGKNRRGNPINRPYYPFWSALSNPSITTNQLFMFPQEFGGFTKLNMPGIQGENLCAYMTSQMELNLGDLHAGYPQRPNGYSVNSENNLGNDRKKDYFNTLDFSDLEPQATEQMENANQFKAPIIKNWLVTKKLAPTSAQVKKITLKNWKGTDNNWREYFLFYYQGGSRKVTPGNKFYAVVWKKRDPNDLRVYFSFLDDDLIEEWDEDQKYYGQPNIEFINEKLLNLFGYRLKNFTLDDFSLTYNFTTYVCGIKNQQNNLEIEMINGFEWGIQKSYFYAFPGNENWMDMVNKPINFNLPNSSKTLFRERLRTFLNQQGNLPNGFEIHNG